MYRKHGQSQSPRTSEFERGAIPIILVSLDNFETKLADVLQKRQMGLSSATGCKNWKHSGGGGFAGFGRFFRISRHNNCLENMASK
jgi:hypothetical protein